jgi:hypothetical protein
MDTYTNVRLPVLIVHRGRMFRLAQTRDGGLVLTAVDPTDPPALDNERGACVMVTADRAGVAKGVVQG